MIIVSEKEKKESSLNVQSLKEEILKDGLAVYGIKETLTAAKNGQIELLIVEKDFKKPGWICEKCQTVEVGKKTSCPYCGKTASNVDIIEEIIEFAERTDADIEFSDDEVLKNIGHIGAILRYK
jgi:peptide chain release factor subunit 1